jgi:hypothetical protein
MSQGRGHALIMVVRGEWNGLGVAKSTENDMMPRLALFQQATRLF